jgi:hypothetical protein
MFSISNIQIAFPTEENIEAALDLWALQKEFIEIDKCIKEVFERYPRHDELGPVLIKLSILNSCYYAGLMDVPAFASSIVEKAAAGNLSRFSSGDPKLVEKTAKAKRRFIVPASKYCHFSYPDKYPMYDAIAVVTIKVINGQRRKNTPLGIINSEIESSYEKWKVAVDTLCSKIKNRKFSYKEIDQYLWLSGYQINRFLKRNVNQRVEALLKNNGRLAARMCNPSLKPRKKP